MSHFAVLQRAFEGDLVLPSDPDYSSAIARWARNAARKAALVAFPKTTNDVSLAVLYAKAQSLPLAVKGGGHNVSGASSSENGLVIDLSRYLNTAVVDPELKLARVGGGAVWGTVDKAGMEHGLATVAGTVNDTGVGGLTLGGGYGWLTGAHGLVVDNLVQATVVIADGSVLVANEKENSDLFWAIRGGGVNFGVCVEFVYKMYEQRRTVFAGSVFFAASAFEAVSRWTEEWWKNGPPPEECMAEAYMQSPMNGNMIIFVFVFFNGSEAEGRERFKGLYDIGPVMDTSKEVPYELLNSLMNTKKGPENVYMKSIVQETFNVDIAKELFDYVAEHSKIPDHRVIVVHEFFSLNKVASVASDAMAFPSRDRLNNLAIQIHWGGNNAPEQMDIVRESARAIMEIGTGKEKNKLAAQNIAYPNYEGEEQVSVDRVQGMFRQNYPRLQQIKKKYDPDMLFRKWFAIEPAR